MSETDCSATIPDDRAGERTADPSGVPFTQLDTQALREQRSSLKWRRFPADVLPLFVAEMDFAVAPPVREAMVRCIDRSDLGYLDQPGKLAPAFAEFAQDRWAWQVPHDYVHLVTDVATGVVEALRVGRPAGGRLVIPTPTYPGFFEMFEEVPFDIVEVPLVADPRNDSVQADTGGGAPAASPSAVFSAPVRLDLAAIEREFASKAGVDAFVLCNPHNPHGLAHRADDLRELARLAAAYDVFIVSDEIHAPLTYPDSVFTPFAPLAAAAGAFAVVTLSASKGWNLAGAKCALLVAADERANDVLRRLPPETVTRASILGLHAHTAAFTDARDWLERAIAQIEDNLALLITLVGEQLPGVRISKPDAGYLVWLDFRAAGLGADPYNRILNDARVAFNDGADFGEGGAGHVRINLACAPQTIREAVARVASILPRAAAAAPTSLDLEATR